jgi:hypothetical protein
VHRERRSLSPEPRRRPEFPFAAVDGLPLQFNRYTRQTLAEFEADNDNETVNSGENIRSTSEIADDNQVHFSAVPKIIIAPYSVGKKIRLLRCDISRPRNHYGSGVHVIEISLDTIGGGLQ